MRIKVLTIFPEMVRAALGESIVGRALEKGLLTVECIDIRAYAQNKHKNTDDYPFGGGAGMVMLAQPIVDACEANAEPGQRRIYLSPRGRTLTQKVVEELAGEEEIMLLCGHYEGVDERALEMCFPEELSIGDYVLTGGETAALVVIDAVSRLLPGVLGSEESAEDESFTTGLLEYPQYTPPPRVSRPRGAGGAPERQPCAHRALAARTGAAHHPRTPPGDAQNGPAGQKGQAFPQNAGRERRMKKAPPRVGRRFFMEALLALATGAIARAAGAMAVPAAAPLQIRFLGHGPHPAMGHALVVVNLADGVKAVAGVEAHRRQLRAQPDLARAQLQRPVEQHAHHQIAQPCPRASLSTQTRPIWKWLSSLMMSRPVPAGRSFSVERQRVDGHLVEAVDLRVGAVTLFVHEHAAADVPSPRAHPPAKSEISPRIIVFPPFWNFFYCTTSRRDFVAPKP